MLVKCLYRKCSGVFNVRPSVVALGYGKFCCKEHYYAYVRDPVVIKERFWSYVDVKGRNDCWLWTGSLYEFGYGQFVFRWKNKEIHVTASHFSWFITYGKTNGLYVCHNCPGGDNPSCVNPFHLFLGTQKENMQDAVKKGRSSFGRKHAGVKYTEDIVRDVRDLADKDYNHSWIASLYGMHKSYVSAIHLRKRWGYLE